MPLTITFTSTIAKVIPFEVGGDKYFVNRLNIKGNTAANPKHFGDIQKQLETPFP